MLRRHPLGVPGVADPPNGLAKKAAAAFQHVADEAVIARYVREIGRVLRPGGGALLQFDTRRKGLDALLYGAVPRRLLPRERREFMRRYPQRSELG